MRAHTHSTHACTESTVNVCSSLNAWHGMAPGLQLRNTWLPSGFSLFGSGPQTLFLTPL